MRFLKLTSPLTKGADVDKLQIACNDWLAKHGGFTLPVDGQFGPLTEHAVGIVAWQMGLGHTVAEPAIQRVIEHPSLRTPEDYLRAKHRAEAAKQKDVGLAGVLANGLTHVGVAENPPGSNEGSPNPSGWEQNFGMNGVSWCGCFAGSMVLAAGGHVGSRIAYVPFIVADAKTGTAGLKTFVAWDADRTPVKPGWLVTYAWDGSHSGGDHVGIVKELTGDGVIACEGNTSGSNPSDGGMVAVMTRSSVDVVGYCEPRFT